MIIKKYKDFNDDEYVNRERESMERELLTRKVNRENTKYDLNINLDMLKREILHIIDTTDNYVVNIGKRIEKSNNSEEYIQHIEFESEKIGRFRLFKPNDITDKGHYEINGDYYETDIKNVRDFYHILKTKIKKND